MTDPIAFGRLTPPPQVQDLPVGVFVRLPDLDGKLRVRPAVVIDDHHAARGVGGVHVQALDLRVFLGAIDQDVAADHRWNTPVAVREGTAVGEWRRSRGA